MSGQLDSFHDQKGIKKNKNGRINKSVDGFFTLSFERVYSSISEKNTFGRNVYRVNVGQNHKYMRRTPG